MTETTLPGWNLIYDAEEIEKGLAKNKAARSSDPRICACGHNARSHASQAANDSPLRALYDARGLETCNPGRMTCPCKSFDAVAECSDVRLFLFKTTGAYSGHALSRGIKQAIDKGVEVKPIGDWNCRACGSSAGGVGPVPITEKREVEGPGDFTLLLCAGCVDLLRRGQLFA